MSPRILALADVHIGAGAAYGRTLRGPGSRLDDQRETCRRIVRVAQDERVDLALIAGDLLHRPRPSVAELLVAQDFVSSLAAYAPVVVISGNAGHDGATPTEPSPIELLAGIPGVFVATEPQVIPLAEASIACLPGVPPSHLAARTSSTDRDALHATIAGMLVELAAGLRAQCAPGRPAILAAHWSVSGASLPNGMSADELREPVLRWPDIESLLWDGVVLGHLHRFQHLAAVRDEPWSPAFYCGSPMPLDFGEAGVPHGIVLLDVDADGLGATHMQIPSRALVTVDWLTCDDLNTIARYGIPGAIAQQARIPGAILRVRYEATAEQARRVDEAAIRRALYDAGAHKVVSITAEVAGSERARVDGMSEDVDDDQALALWLDAQDVAEGLADGALELHTAYRGGVPA